MVFAVFFGISGSEFSTAIIFEDRRSTCDHGKYDVKDNGTKGDKKSIQVNFLFSTFWLEMKMRNERKMEMIYD